MKKIIIGFILVALALGIVSVAVAASNKLNKAVKSDPESASYTKYHGKGIWSTTHIMRKDDIKPEKVSKKPIKTGPSCYKLMGVEWPTTPNYVAQDNELLGIAGVSIATWDNETEFDLLGSGDLNTAGFGDISNPVMDEKNSYSYGDYPLTGVIAVCRTWWNTNGEIVEYDIMFDTDFSWGDATNPSTPNVMDLQNIATHEIGHGFGLLDLYNRPCKEQTMYGYSGYGETKKQDLGTGDILGIQALYGIATE